MLSEEDKNRIIEMAWEDRTPFEVIHSEFDLTHNELIALMRNNLKPRSLSCGDKGSPEEKLNILN